jgi:hypothetical protein
LPGPLRRKICAQSGRPGEFYAVDRDDDHARWEQAFSYDDRTWQTNWTADFERAD